MISEESHSSPPRQIAVRDTLPDELDIIFGIHCNPLVAPYQFRVSAGTFDVWRSRLVGEWDTDWGAFRCCTILDGAKVIGYVSQWHVTTSDRLSVECGWSLAPDYWGRGVMGEALGQLFDRFFATDGVTQVFANCFRSNRRCIRLLDKLGFVPIRMPVTHRVQIALSARCSHWIKRFQLDAAAWSNPSTISRDGV